MTTTTKRSTLRSRSVLAAIAAVSLTASAFVAAPSDAAPRPAGPAVALGPLAPPPTATTCTGPATARDCDLWAKAGSVSLPGTPGYASLPIWGFTDSQAGAAALVGPTVVVTEGDQVTFHLHNDLPGTKVSLEIPSAEGLAPASDDVGAATGAAKDYTFDASRPGTYLYQAGPTADQRIQLGMGLIGALVVRPTDPTRAYADSSTTFTDEAVLVMSDVDPALNTATNPTAFDMRTFAPTYRLINGHSYPDTDTVGASSGGRLLLRQVNAGSQDHALLLYGLHQRVVADDSTALPPVQQYAVTGETVGAGQTVDTIVDVPSTAPSGRQYLLADGGGELYNPQGATAGASVAFGGMLTAVVIGGVAPPPVCHPEVTSVNATPPAYAPSGSASLSATIGACVGTPVTAAEYSDGPAGPWTAMTLSGSTATATVPGLSVGPHTLYVHAVDANGPGDPGTDQVYVDGVGPTTSGLSVTPDPHHSGSGVTVRATGDDRTTGGANVTAAEAFDGGVVTGSTPTLPGTIPATTSLGPTTGSGTAVVAFSGSLSIGTASGRHAVWVRSRDALGNWGDWAYVLLTEDNTAPAPTVGYTPTVVPNPTNGLIGYNASSANVKVTVSFTDALTPITGMRGWIDTVSGSGAALTPVDGAWNSPTEVGQLLIALPTIRALSNGPHSIFVQATDSAGNVSPASGFSIPFTVDKTAPVLTASTTPVFQPNPTNGLIGYTTGATTARVSVSFTDNALTITGIRGWIDTVSGTGTAFTATDGSFNSTTEAGQLLLPLTTIRALANGVHNIRIQATDAAGNVSATVSVPFTVDKTAPAITNQTRTGRAVTLTATDAVGVSAGEYYVGSDPGPGAATPMPAFATATSVTRTITVPAPGAWNFRFRDAAGNWSAVRTVTVP